MPGAIAPGAHCARRRGDRGLCARQADGGAVRGAARPTVAPMSERGLALRARGLGRSYDGFLALVRSGSRARRRRAGRPGRAQRRRQDHLPDARRRPAGADHREGRDRRRGGRLDRRAPRPLLHPRHPGLLRGRQPRRAPRVRRRPARERGRRGADRLLARSRLGLAEWEDALPSQFSRGMRQKASIALALVRPFSVLLADEPLDGLDPPSRDVFFELLAESRAEGAAVVVSTHRPDVIAAASRCVGIREGQAGLRRRVPTRRRSRSSSSTPVADRG